MFHCKIVCKTLESKPISMDNIPASFVFDGDEAFGKSEKVMVQSNSQQNKYKYKLSRARRHIECLHGI